MISDTYILLEQLGHRLDRESERRFNEALAEGLSDTDITEYIERNIDVAARYASPRRCGTEAMCCVWRHRFRRGLSPCAIPGAYVPRSGTPTMKSGALCFRATSAQTTFNVEASEIRELMPGQAVVISRSGKMRLERIMEPKKVLPCSFERVYFSRGSDVDIYRERKQLGRNLVGPILEAIDGEIDDTVFSYIPNTAESAFFRNGSGIQRIPQQVQGAEIIGAEGKLTPRTA